MNLSFFKPGQIGLRYKQYFLYYLTYLSYAMAIYSMVILGQVYTLTELSEPALKALTVTLGGKVLSNIFEHNNNKFFGTSVGSTDAEGGV